jgi:hypothetical protein
VLLETGVELLHSRFRAERLLAQLLKPPDDDQNATVLAGELDIRRAVSLVLRVTRNRFSCLHQSIAAARVLRRRGISATVRIAPHGFSKEKFTAHAWVELADRSIIGRILTTQPPFFRNIRTDTERGRHDE